LWEKVNPISLSISPFLVIDANTNQSKYIKCKNELVRIRWVHRLLGIKPIYNLTRYEWIAFFYLTFWTTFAPLVLFFANLFGKSFQSLLQIVKDIWIRLQEAFSWFEISPHVSNDFPLTKQNSPWMKFFS
jgi:hypothetical protein